jgi:hypothetical protein
MPKHFLLKEPRLPMNMLSTKALVGSCLEGLWCVLLLEASLWPTKLLLLLEHLLLLLRRRLCEVWDAAAVHHQVEHGLALNVLHRFLVSHHRHVVPVHLHEGNENGKRRSNGHVSSEIRVHLLCCARSPEEGKGKECV